MIELRNLCKTYNTNGSRKVVADNISALFPSHKAVAILGRNGAGKSTLLRMISGALDADSGEVIRGGSVSWPVGFAGSFHPDLSGLQNVRFIARVYGVDTDELACFAQNFAELGDHFFLPFRTYSSGMRSRLAFGVSMGIKFDTYLVDEITAVGDAAFRAKSETLFMQRIEECGAVMVTHSMGQVRRLCHAAAVLEDGKLYYHENVNAAIRHHARLMGQPNMIDE